MTIVLGAPLVLVNLLAIRGNMLEGMEGQNDEQNDEAEEVEEEDEEYQEDVEEEQDPTIMDLPTTDDNKTTATINNSAAAVTINTVAEDNPAQSQDGFETGRRKTRGSDLSSAASIREAYSSLF